MRKFGLLIFILCYFISFRITAQDERFGTIGQYSIEADYQFGRIIPHESKFKAPVTAFTHTGEIGFYKQTLGKKAWQRKLNYPEIGGSFQFIYNGDQKVFGNVYMGLLSAKFWMVRSRYIDFFIRASTGLAVVPTHYNPVTNPLNDAIGSTLNSADELRFGVDFKIDPNFQVMWGITLTHYSNGASQLPNLGVNVPGLTMGVRVFPKVNDAFKYDHSKVPKPDKRNEVMVRFGLGINALQAPGGPRYINYIGTVNYARYTSITNKVLIGATAEYSVGAYDYAVLQEIVGKYSAAASATKIGFFVGDEILIGRVGLLFAAGHYFFTPPTSFTPFVKLGVDYYFADSGKKKSTKFFVGAGLKTYYLVAQFYEVSTGVAF